jgi:hypothetical protein
MTRIKKAIYLVLALVVLLSIVACKPKVETPPAPVAPPVETPAPVAPPVETTIAPLVETTPEGKVAYGTSGILSNVKCDSGKISATITNLKEETLSILPKNKGVLRVMVNGVNMIDFVCDKTELGAKETVQCSDLVGNDAIKPKLIRTTKANQVSAWFQSDEANRGILDVECTGTVPAAGTTGTTGTNVTA